jgi:hypothetical protein
VQMSGAVSSPQVPLRSPRVLSLRFSARKVAELARARLALLSAEYAPSSAPDCIFHACIAAYRLPILPGPLPTRDVRAVAAALSAASAVA